MISEKSGDSEKPHDENPVPGVPRPAISASESVEGGEVNAAKTGSSDNPIHIRDPEMAAWTAALVRWTRAIVGVAIISAAISYFQWRELQSAAKQTDEAITATNRIADATKKQADAAIQQAKAAIDAADKQVSQLRAYVFVDTVQIYNADDDITKNDPNKFQTAVLSIRNFGQTPAYKVRHIATVKFTDFPPGPKVFEHLPSDSISSVDILPAGGPASQKILDPHIALDSPRKLLLMSETKAIYVFGKIDYEDAFGIARCTRYRFMVGGSAGFHGNDMFKMDAGNEADKDCEKPD